MSEPTPTYRRSAIWDVKLRFHSQASTARDTGSPMLTLTVTGDTYEDAIDGALWAAVEEARRKGLGAGEEDYEVMGVDRIRGCTVV